MPDFVLGTDPPVFYPPVGRCIYCDCQACAISPTSTPRRRRPARRAPLADELRSAFDIRDDDEDEDEDDDRRPGRSES
jgi:hypothetical protein